MLAVANGNRLTFCDLLSGGRVLHTTTAHSKTITALCAPYEKHASSTCGNASAINLASIASEARWDDALRKCGLGSA